MVNSVQIIPLFDQNITFECYKVDIRPGASGYLKGIVSAIIDHVKNLRIRQQYFRSNHIGLILWPVLAVKQTKFLKHSLPYKVLVKKMVSYLMGAYNPFHPVIQVVVYECPRYFVKNHVNAFQNSKILYHLDLQADFVCNLERISGIGICHQFFS